MKAFQINYTFDGQNCTEIVSSDNEQTAVDDFREGSVEEMMSNPTVPDDTDLYNYFDEHYSIDSVKEVVE